ncbi:MAG TPA: GIY-YIG nuclease family protein [Noviherbaspirillum sp.]|nr:GIY-YIG nuclease family protein [Noviherbaspirillum sp.]
MTGESMAVSGIYAITNTINGKVYVGLSSNIQKRWQTHRVPKIASKSAIHSAIRKHGVAAFRFEVLERCPVSKLSEREKHWIALLKTYQNGYNLTTGGQEGHERSQETKNKISRANTGKIRSKEFCDAMSAHRIGKKQPIEWVQKAALARTGLKRSEETKRKQSENCSFRRPEMIARLKSDNPMHRPEARKKLSEALTGRVFSDEAKARMSASAKARGGPSDETKAKLAAALRGIKRSPESIAKRLETLRRNREARL